MDTAKRFTKSRILAFVFSVVVPFVVIAFGVKLLFANFLFNAYFALAFIIMLLSAIFLSALATFSNLKRSIKVISLMLKIKIL
ncbi:MAG: hypothetical protein E7480_00685 [Ruminococcaceae bacterium]|nr:hypothetical protein [Oscillospiraceae bacterium]